MSFYVVLHPNSNSNPSSKFRVVFFSEWVENGTYRYTAFDTFEAAYAYRDQKNGALVGAVQD